MPRFRFTKDFDFKPISQTTIGFKAGHEGDIVTAPAISGKITNAVVDAATKAKAGEVIGAEPKAAAKAKDA